MAEFAAAFPHQLVPVDFADIVRNNIYLYGIRGEGRSATHRAEAFMSQRRFDATLVHTHSFAFEDAIKLVVRTRGIALQRAAAE